jgi:hypothetical protein
LDDNKKPGQRDISDLKARLGLKKTGGTSSSPGDPTPPPVAAPPAAQAVPSPFGQPQAQAAAPQPQAPPDPRRDPFAQQQAANLAAFYGIGVKLPGDASSVEAGPISKPKPWGTLALFGVVAVVLFGVGNACGRVYSSRVEFNHTIDQAGQIQDEVDRLAKQLNVIADVLNASKLTTQKQPDFDMAKKLKDLDLKKPDTERLFHTNYYHFEDAAIERLFTYYDHTIKLYDLVIQHAKRTDNDKQAIDNYAKNAAAATKGEKNYGVTLDMTGAIPLAHFVELGTPECPQPDQTDCKATELKGFKVKTDPGGNWTSRPIKGKPQEIVFPMQRGPLFGSVAAGNPDMLAYEAYFRRVIDIKTLAGALVAEQKELQGDLKKTVERPKVFVF